MTVTETQPAVTTTPITAAEPATAIETETPTETVTKTETVTETKPVTETGRAVESTVLPRTDVVRPDAIRDAPVAGAPPPPDERQRKGTPEPVPRPEGEYPRAIAHTEQVAYSYDPVTGEFDAQVVESDDPVVTAWDTSPPLSDERAVSSWDVTPTDDGVVAQPGEDMIVPEGIKARLREQAEQEGGPVSIVADLRVDHDLDNRTTSYATKVPTSDSGEPEYEPTDGSLAGVFQDDRDALSPEPDGSADGALNDKYASIRDAIDDRGSESASRDGALNDKYASILKAMNKTQEQKARTRQSRRASSANLKENQGYSLPQILLIQEAAPTRRIGGL